MPSDAASPAVSALGDLLKYGVPGLALAIMIVCFYSLHMLQKQALAGQLDPGRIEPFVRLQRLYLFASVLVFCVSVVAPHYFKEPVNMAHRIAFSMSPASFEKDELMPRLVVAGGMPVPIKEGTGQDTFAGERAYLFDVDKLAREREFYKRYVEQSQLQSSVNREGGHSAQSNR